MNRCRTITGWPIWSACPPWCRRAAGLVAIEAMACGRPVLATRSGGMPEYLDGSQAVLVDTLR